jgi:hypothetical protein
MNIKSANLRVHRQSMKTNLIWNAIIIHRAVGLNDSAINSVLKRQEINLLGIGALFGINAIAQ